MRRFSLVVLLVLIGGAALSFAEPPAAAAAPPEGTRLADALDIFERAVEERWSYLQPSRFDHKRMITALRRKLDAAGGQMTEDEFAIELQRIIGCGIDGHAGVTGGELPRGYLPFLIEPVGERFVAFRDDRGGLLDPQFPWIDAIDGRALPQWLEAASALVPNGSSQYVRWQALRSLRSIQFFRGEVGLEAEPTLEVTLVSADGRERKTVTLDVAPRGPVYGVWPRPDRKPKLPSGIAYLRLAEMSAAAAGPRIQSALAELADETGAAPGTQAESRGLIIDVRDNSGGSRVPLQELAAVLVKPSDPPRVFNAAVYRLHPAHDEDRMTSRFLYPADWAGWSDAERSAIATFRKTFKPEWSPPPGVFSEWHYAILGGGRGGRDDRRDEDGNVGRPIDIPVVVLMNAKCFSATDVFLSAIKGLPNVTLLGTASSGGSANADIIPLDGTRLRVRLGTMVSFQATGRLFDTHGVEPDVPVEPTPDFFIGGADNQLEAAIRVIGQKEGNGR